MIEGGIGGQDHRLKFLSGYRTSREFGTHGKGHINIGPPPQSPHFSLGEFGKVFGHIEPAITRQA